jgi:proteasome assembly chaperone (PAC2) family protein
LDVHRIARLKDAVLLVSVSTSIPQYQTLYSHGRVLADYMMDNMKFERIASIYSSSFPPEVVTREDGTVGLPACHFHLHKSKRALLLFSGDSSPFEDQYQFTDRVLALAQELGVKDVYSVGARWTEIPISPAESPAVIGFASDLAGVERLKSNGVALISNEPAPFFASIVVGLAASYGMTGYKISVNHGEPAPHPRSVSKMLEVISKMAGFEIDLKDLQVQPPDVATVPRSDASSIYH